MEWKINNKHSDFYLPRTERWIIDTFDLTYEKAVLYQMILNKGYTCWTQSWIANVFKISLSKIKRILKDLADKGIILIVPYNVSSDDICIRNIYIPLYDINGHISDEQIKKWIEQGKQKIKLDYLINKKKSKNSNHVPHGGSK